MFDECIRRHAADRPGDDAVLSATGTVSFARFDADIDRAVRELRDVAVEAGESVSIAIDHAYLEWVVIMALARCAVASAPPADAESRFQLSDRNPDGSRDNVIFLGEKETARILDGPSCTAEQAIADPDALGRVFRTSGTTGPSKRVAVSWRALDAIVTGSAAAYGTAASPWYVTTGTHTPFGFDLALAAWSCGHAVVVAGFGPAAASIAALKPGLLGLIPLHLRHLLETFPQGIPRWPMRIVTAGSAIPPRLAQEAVARFSPDLVNHFGSTETATMASGEWKQIERISGAIGFIRPGCAVRTVDEEGRELPSGASGRLCFSTPALASGYLGDPELSAEAFKDGWFHSNDIGHLRADGILVVEGRADDVMNLGGHKILPAVVEEVALTCPGVRDVAAFATSSENGDNCWLAIAADSKFDSNALRRALRLRISSLQRVGWFRCDEIPRNERGKVDRNRLREELAKWHASQG